MTHSQNASQLSNVVRTRAFGAQEAALRKQTHSKRLSSALSISTFFSTLGLIALLCASAAHAAKAPIFTSYLNNDAVGGYDVVSYFQGAKKPVKGKTKYKTSYKGADWLFANQENLDAFSANPEKYRPQYGGYCAYAVARGSTVKGDPLQYHISNGKLYLNYNEKYKNIWLNDKHAFIEKGDMKWPELLQ